MPIMWGVALFFFFLAVLALGTLLFRRDAGVFGALGLFVVLGVLFTIGSSWNTVPVRNIGIVTSFNKPTGEVTGSGSVWVAPWKKVKDWDASMQTSDQTGGGFVQDGVQCTGSTLVRIGSMATACVENKIRWQVFADNAPMQYNTYKGDFENFTRNYFETERQNALNEVFASYNPLATFDASVGSPSFDLAAKQDELKTALNKRVCPGGTSVNDKGEHIPATPGTCQIIVESISIPLIHHDAKTEAQIKNQQDLIAKGRNLAQEKINADKQNAITVLKAKTSIEQQCLDLAAANGFHPGVCLQPGWGNAPITKTK